jgi:hypothetical protein
MPPGSSLFVMDIEKKLYTYYMSQAEGDIRYNFTGFVSWFKGVNIDL